MTPFWHRQPPQTPEHEEHEAVLQWIPLLTNILGWGPGTTASFQPGTYEVRKPSYLPLYWLVNRDLYNGILESPFNREGISSPFTLKWLVHRSCQETCPGNETVKRSMEKFSILYYPNNQALGIQSYSQLMIGMSNHILSRVFGFHYHSQKVIGSLGKVFSSALTSHSQQENKTNLLSAIRLLAFQPLPSMLYAVFCKYSMSVQTGALVFSSRLHFLL